MMEQMMATLGFGFLFLMIFLIVLYVIEKVDFRKLLERIRKRSWE